MKRTIAILTLAVVFGLTGQSYAKGEFKAKREAFKEQQKSENKAFRETLKGKAPEEKKSAVLQHREEQFGDRTKFRDEMYQERMNKIDGNSKLSDEQKSKIKSFAAQQKEKAEAHRNQQHKENMDFINSLPADMPKEEKKAAVKAHREQQQAENKAFWESMKQERESMKGEIKGAKTQE
jgi:hypothetical protein